jgi:catechol 2,3-dioxygenase-like lactoylglutathione lyase family enzyme
MIVRSVDHVGIAVSSLEVSIPWWSEFLGEDPFDQKTWLAEDTDDYVGGIVGYEGCDMSGAYWALPGGTVLELLEYHEPQPGEVDMESYNAGNTHLGFETSDIHADYERMAGKAEFRSEAPVQSTWGPYKGTWCCYLRDPDGVSIELVQFPESGRPFDAASPFMDPKRVDR